MMDDISEGQQVEEKAISFKMEEEKQERSEDLRENIQIDTAEQPKKFKQEEHGIEMGINLIMDGEEDALLDMMDQMGLSEEDLVSKLKINDMFNKQKNLEAVENVVIPGRGIYTGQIKKTNEIFVLQGYGVMLMGHGEKYEGFWQNNLFSKKGKLWTDDHCYEGQWKNGKMNGNGTITFEDGRKYQGNFKMGAMTGF